MPGAWRNCPSYAWTPEARRYGEARQGLLADGNRSHAGRVRDLFVDCGDPDFRNASEREEVSNQLHGTPRGGLTDDQDAQGCFGYQQLPGDLPELPANAADADPLHPASDRLRGDGNLGFSYGRRSAPEGVQCD